MDGPQDSTLPLFPLETPVLFPELQVPLHVFEPRYRRLVRDLLARKVEERRIGMATVPPEHRGEMAGTPPLFPVGCAGRLVRVRPRSDGRFDILLRAQRRFRIRREHPPDGGRPYRVAEVTYLAERRSPEDEPRIEALRQRVLERLRELFPGVRREEIDRLARLDAAVLASAVAVGVIDEPVERQGLLEADGVAERLARLEALLGFRVAARTGGVLPRRARPH